LFVGTTHDQFYAEASATVSFNLSAALYALSNYFGCVEAIQGFQQLSRVGRFNAAFRSDQSSGTRLFGPGPSPSKQLIYILE
jgi:hypothetical protein